MFVYLLFGLQIHVDLFYCMGHLILQFKLKKGWICLYLLLHFCNTLVLFYEMVLIIWNNCSVFFSTVFVWYCIRMFVYIINACLLGIPWTRQQRQQKKKKITLLLLTLVRRSVIWCISFVNYHLKASAHTIYWPRMDKQTTIF